MYTQISCNTFSSIGNTVASSPVNQCVQNIDDVLCASDFYTLMEITKLTLKLCLAMR